MTKQERSVKVESLSNNSNSINHFPRLVSITLTHVHTDYANEFLCQSRSHVPRLSSLKIKYAELATVTENFTSDFTRFNCAQLKKLLIEEQMVYPRHFYLYFPLL